MRMVSSRFWEGGRQSPRHGQVPQHLGAPVAQGHGQERVRDELVRRGGVAVAQELVVRISVGLRQEGHKVRRGLRPREVIGEGGRYGIVGLLSRVVPAELGEHPGLAGLGEQQGIGLRPGVGIDQIGGTAKGGDLRQDGIDGCLQRRDLAGQGEGPGALQRQDVGVVAVQPAVSERGVEGRLLHVGQQSRGHSLVHVGGGLPAATSMDGQLVHHALQRLLVEAMLEFIAAVVGWFASLRSTEAGVDLPSTWTCRASRADWLALEARPRVRLVLTAVGPEALAAMRPSAAERSAAKA